MDELKALELITSKHKFLDKLTQHPYYSDALKNEFNQVIKDQLSDFIIWYDNLTPSEKCTAHPPKGSGGCYGIYTLTAMQIIEKYLKLEK